VTVVAAHRAREVHALRGHYGKKSRCRATRLCHAAVHGKDFFAVYQQNGAHGKEHCTVKLLTTHGKEG
jgi:hypothetical protein